ncbi:MAG TPA: hypothetical protein VHB54_04810 [Mucilaginibacter sp.]|nr:hypothetical protein [Mucilaginibacter sp.]
MKFINYALSTLVLIGFGLSVSAQKYKTPADTVKLNQEYVNVSNDIANINAQLTIAQNNLPGYQTKASTATANAQTAASTSSAGAAKATNGNIGDAKSAKNDADDAYDKAEDSRNANNNVGRQDEKIRKLKARLHKKQQRLKDLDVMRNAIYAQIPSNQ